MPLVRSYICRLLTMCCIEAVIMCSVLKRMNCVCGDIDVLFEGGVGSIVCAFFVSLHPLWSGAPRAPTCFGGVLAGTAGHTITVSFMSGLIIAVAPILFAGALSISRAAAFTVTVSTTIAATAAFRRSPPVVIRLSVAVAGFLDISSDSNARHFREHGHRVAKQQLEGVLQVGYEWPGALRGRRLQGRASLGARSRRQVMRRHLQQQQNVVLA